MISQRHQTEHLPMTSQAELDEVPQKSILPFSVIRCIAMLVVATIILIVALTILSVEVVKNQKKYKGNITPYLPIYSGQIEYSRMPVQYWEHRLKMVKAMGLNAVSIYVMWNHHQISKGIFDFKNDNKNLKLFLQLTQKYDLNVLFRPGPYVCAEWDFGGLPARLLGIDGLVIRSANKKYEDEVRVYFEALAPIIKPFLAVNGGNIIMLQIQNEYGYIGQDNQHILNLLQMWQHLGVQSEFYFQDPGAFWQVSYWPGAHIGISCTQPLLRYMDIDLSPIRDKDSLVFGGQVYTGWFSQWGFEWGSIRTAELDYLIQTLEKMIENGRSFSLYMSFGGTNFGVAAGADGKNGFYQYLPMITSYDYDSPISEQGRATDKYLRIRSLLQKHYGQQKIDNIPEPIPTITIEQFTPEIQGDIWANLPQHTKITSKIPFFQSPQLQMYNQGIVIYQTLLPQSRYYYFVATICDFGLIFLDDQFIKQVVRSVEEVHQFEINCQKQKGCKLKILIEAMGHKKFGKDMRTDRKGLLYFKEIGTDIQYSFTTYKIPVHDHDFSTFINKSHNILFPTIFKADITLSQIGDTYFDMSQFKKGYLYVNGHLLGRYWNIGPQQRLFCPGVWLKKGQNKVMIVDLVQTQRKRVRGLQSLKG